MRMITYLLIASCAFAGAASACCENWNAPNPLKDWNTKPDLGMAHTTPMTNDPIRILPQARQVGNPTGPVPNAPGGILQPPKLPQASPLPRCPDFTKRNCGL